MNNEKKFKLTSFYVDEEQLNTFKIYAIQNKTSLKKLFNDLIYFINTSDEFKSNFENLITSGSV